MKILLILLGLSLSKYIGAPSHIMEFEQSITQSTVTHINNIEYLI
jgi:hypothetical protein